MVCDCVSVCVCCWHLHMRAIVQFESVWFDLHVLHLGVMQRKSGIQIWCYHVISIFLFNSTDYTGTICRIYTARLFYIQHISCVVLYLSSLATGMLPRPRGVLHTIALWNSLSLITQNVAFFMTFLFFHKNTFVKNDLLYMQQKIYITLQGSNNNDKCMGENTTNEDSLTSLADTC